MYYGLNEFREQLIAEGWKIGFNAFRSHDFNTCNWYAWKRSSAKTECISNEKPPSLIVYPFHSKTQIQHENYEVELCGEVPTGWIKLLHYSHEVPKFFEELPAIDKSLVAAWEALHTVNK
jgi:hypothetical protein